MNLSQILECLCSKPTWATDQRIKKNPNNFENYLTELNETVLKYLGNPEYYNNIKYIISECKNNSIMRENIISNILENNLYIEVPSFTKLNLRSLCQTASPKVNEDVVLPKNLIKYMKQKMNCFQDLIITDDIVLKNIFCGPMYIQKLHKIANKLTMARDLGPLKFITQQPQRGRASGGGAALGQMEIEAIIANGCEQALTEMLTIKNDWNSEKKKFLWDLITTGKYHLPDQIPNNSSRTKTVVNTILKFLKK